MSVHKECGPSWGWQEINSSDPPDKPQRADFNSLEQKAQKTLDNFKPTLVDKLARRVDSKRQELVEAVKSA